MPRKPRRISNSGIYHVVLRGINRQCIFEDDEDYDKFLELLAKYKEVTLTSIYGYCLMNNHVHLLIKSDNLSSFMSKIGAGYVYWFNWKYDRIGGLFQDRFRSEPVCDDKYFMTALRYIHRNPIKAGITSFLDMYKYSSYCDYTENGRSEFVDIGFVLNMITLKQFITFHNDENHDENVELIDECRVNDARASEIIREVSNTKHLSEFQSLDSLNRDCLLRAIKKEGITIRQLERLTGIKRGIIQRA